MADGTSKSGGTNVTVVVDFEKVSILQEPNEIYPYIGEEFNYTIKIGNENRTGINVNVIDELPDGLEYVASGDSGIYNENDGTVTWSNVTVPGHRH